MWCSQCQADVATEIANDGQRLLCTICGEEVRKVFAPSQHPETQSARDLLERWSKNSLLDSLAASSLAEEPDEVDVVEEQPAEVAVATMEVSEPPAAPAVETAAEAEPEDEDEDAGADLLPSTTPRLTAPAPAPAPNREVRPIRKIHRGGRPPAHREPAARRDPPRKPNTQPVSLNWRFDQAHQSSPPAISHIERIVEEAPVEPPRVLPAAPTYERRDDFAHRPAPAPHFELESFALPTQRPGKQETIFGQILAYVGVGLLTIGTALVVWGYFGGPAVQKYQSTGWLISTAGQMLLFLGVVTLVSGGMQQTTHEVSQRVEYLGNRMLRIEQSTQEILKGPYFAKSREGQTAGARRQDNAESA
jgi:hypothetical protein